MEITKKKIWHIGDTHSYHYLLDIPKDIDIVIHSGDFSNFYDIYKNEPEARDFLVWFGNLPIKNKVLIAGNHDAFCFHRKAQLKELCDYYKIVYLENDFTIIDGIKIWGSPNTPSFGNWYFMKDRSKLDAIWKNIPEDTDIVVVHGPPKGILDFSYRRDGVLEFCGCKALRNHILERVKPKLFLSGHIHNYEDIINAGVCKLSAYNTIFSNGSVVTDGKFGLLSSNGNILEI